MCSCDVNLAYVFYDFVLIDQSSAQFATASVDGTRKNEKSIQNRKKKKPKENELERQPTRIASALASVSS